MRGLQTTELRFCDRTFTATSDDRVRRRIDDTAHVLGCVCDGVCAGWRVRVCARDGLLRRWCSVAAEARLCGLFGIWCTAVRIQCGYVAQRSVAERIGETAVANCGCVGNSSG